MKSIYIIMLVLILSISTVGCAAPATDTPTEPSINEPSEPSSTDRNTQEVIITASYEKPESFSDSNTIVLDGLLEGEEYIEVVVRGEIFDFAQIELIWNEDKSVLEEKQIIKKIDKISNQTLVIKTMQPEGIPTEKMKLKSKSGEVYEYIIQENSLGVTKI